MIFWSGWGLLTAAIVVVCVGTATGLATDLSLPENLCVAAGVLLAALLNFGVARWRDRRPTREFVDVKTGERLQVREGSSLFFVPLRYRTYVLFGFAVLSLVLLPARAPVRKGPPARAASLARS